VEERVVHEQTTDDSWVELIGERVGEQSASDAVSVDRLAIVFVAGARVQP
jgi:hypothetical protein